MTSSMNGPERSDPIEQDDETVLPTNSLSRISLGDYHSARLTMHDRSDTSSPVSNSEEDEEGTQQDSRRQPYLKGHSHGRSVAVAPQSRNGRAIWNSNSEEDFDTAHDNEIAFKPGWNTSDAAVVMPLEDGSVEELKEWDEPVANRIPNEIIMHVSELSWIHNDSLIAHMMSLDPPLHPKYAGSEECSTHLKSMVSVHRTHDMDKAIVQRQGSQNDYRHDQSPSIAKLFVPLCPFHQAPKFWTSARHITRRSAGGIRDLQQARKTRVDRFPLYRITDTRQGSRTDEGSGSGRFVWRDDDQ